MERLKWPGAAVLLGALGALLRRWQMNTAFEETLGLHEPGSPATAALIAFFVLAAAVCVLLGFTTFCRESREGRLSRWDQVFAAEGDGGYMTLMVLAALLTAAACPLLLREAAASAALFKARQGSDNGLLLVVLALCAVLSAGGMVLSARDAYRMKGQGRENGVLLLPPLMGCVWMLEAYRANAPDPVLWNYVPLLLAAGCALLFYLECAALSFEKGHPRRMLALAALTVITGAVALVSHPGMAQAALLLGQMLAALAALWVAPTNLSYPPAADRFGLRARRRKGLPLNEEEYEAEPDEDSAQEIQEEDTHV